METVAIPELNSSYLFVADCMVQFYFQFKQHTEFDYACLHSLFSLFVRYL